MTASSPTAPPIGEGTRCRWFSLTGTTRTLRFVVVLAVLGGPMDAATWNGRLVAAPFWANSQLLWYRRSAAARAGLDPATGPVTWDQVIAAAERAGVTTEVQGARYEGYMVLISALVASAGGPVVDHPQAGRGAHPADDTPAGHPSADV